MGDDVDVDALSDDLHGTYLLGRDRHDEDTVVIVVGGLYLGEVGAYLVIGRRVEVGKEDGALHAGTALLQQVLRHKAPHFIALYVVHHEKQHIRRFTFFTVHQSQHPLHPLLYRAHIVVIDMRVVGGR